MKRRDFIALLGGAAAAWPLAAGAQQPGPKPTIGYLGATSPSAESRRIAALMQRLRELGWMEGRNVTIEHRRGEGRSERFAELAAEFVQLKVDARVACAWGRMSPEAFAVVSARPIACHLIGLQKS